MRLQDDDSRSLRIPPSVVERVGILIGAVVFRSLVAAVSATLVVGVCVIPFRMASGSDSDSIDRAWQLIGYIWLGVFAITWIIPGIAGFVLKLIFGDRRNA